MPGPQSGVSIPKSINCCLSVCVILFLILSTFKHTKWPRIGLFATEKLRFTYEARMVLFFLSPYALPDYFLGELMQSSRKLEGFSTDEALTNAPMSSAQSSCSRMKRGLFPPSAAWITFRRLPQPISRDRRCLTAAKANLSSYPRFPWR